MSILEIVQEAEWEREYCSQVFYLGQPNLCQIHFVVTWNIEAHLTAVKNEYEKKGAKPGLHQPLEFESDSITLDIPLEGITINGWIIIPLMRPVITKKQVDNYSWGKLIPRCQLKAEYCKRGEDILTLHHPIFLIGAKYPNNIFALDLPAAILESDAPTFGDLVHVSGLAKKRSQLEQSSFPEVTDKDFEPEAERKPSPISTLLVKEEITGPDTQPADASWCLRGVEVCGEMTTVVYSSHTQQITWEDFGLKLYIRKDSLPVGTKQCIVNIKASLTGQYEIPEDCHVVSAVFWFHCDTVHSFAKQITLEIDHCAKFESDTNLQLSFIKAICSQTHLPYTFKEIGGDFTSHSSYGVIELRGFSGYAVTQKGSNNKLYRSRLFYLKKECNTYEIHFVMFWNTPAHLKVVMEEYKKEGARPGADQNIEFESEMITLNVPIKGKRINGWKITPLIRPVITKRDVDDFKPGKGTPRCQFKVEHIGKRKTIPALTHQVTLKGARPPHNLITFDIPAGAVNVKRSPSLEESASDLRPNKVRRLEGATSAIRTSQRLAGASTSKQVQQSSSTSSGGIGTIAAGLDTKLTLAADHFQVSAHLQDLNDQQLRNVGGALGLSYSIMGKMSTLPEDMVAAWLRREDFVMSMSGEPTWKTLVEALKKVGQGGIAGDIEDAVTE